MSDALRRALEYVDESRAAAAQQPANLREAADAQDMWAPTRAYEAGRLATDINANNADIARLRANNRAQEADVLERQNQALAQRQAVYAPDIARVEDIGSKNGYLRDGLSWFGSQLGNAAASAQDPLALAAAGTAVGKAVGAVPRLSAVGKAIQYGSQLGAFGLNQRQMTGEMYGRLRDDPVAFANMTPQEAYRTSNLYGVGAGALESLLPGTVGHALGGGALRAGGRAALQRGAGATLLKDAATEGGTELAEQYAQQQVHSAYNPQRSTRGDFSENLNAGLGGAAGGVGLGAPHAIADAAYGRAARTGEVVREKAGETVDLLKEKAPQVYEDSGVKGVVDLGAEKARGAYEGVAGAFKKATDYLRDEQGRINYPEATRKAMADYDRYKMSQEEADILTAVPPEGLDPEGTKAWAQENDVRRGELIANRLAALEADGVQEASPLLDAVTGDDPVAQFEALNQATEFLLQRNAAAQVDRKAAVLREFTGNKIQQAAHAVTRAAQKAAGAAVFTGMNVAEGVNQAMDGRKRNAQGTQGESAPLTYAQWMAARAAAGRAFDAHGAKLRAQKRAATPAPAPEQVQAATTAGELFARAAAREDLGGDVRAREDYGRSLAYELSEMAQEYELRGFVRPSVFDALADDLRDTLGKDAQDAVLRMAALEGGSQLLTDMAAKVSNATLRARRPTQLQDQLIAQLPQEHQAEIRKSGAADLQEAVLDIARGRMSERRIKEIEKAIGGDTLRRMLEIVDGPDEVFSARAQNEAPMSGEAAEVLDADRLSVNDDGEVGAAAVRDDFEQRQAERKAQKNAGPSMYMFSGQKAHTIQTTDATRRNPKNPFDSAAELTPIQRAKIDADAKALGFVRGDLEGTPLPSKPRPRLVAADDAKSARKLLGGKMQEFEAILQGEPHEVDVVSAREVLDDLGMQPAGRLAMFRDYMFQGARRKANSKQTPDPLGAAEDVRMAVLAHALLVDTMRNRPEQELTRPSDLRTAGTDRATLARRNGPKPHRSVPETDIASVARWVQQNLGEKAYTAFRHNTQNMLRAAAGRPIRDYRGKKTPSDGMGEGERAQVQEAMERFFANNYLIRAREAIDRVPGKIAAGELIEMAKAGAKKRSAVEGDIRLARDGSDRNAQRDAMEGQLLNFAQPANKNLLGTKDSTLSIGTDALVGWVRANHRHELKSKDDDKRNVNRKFVDDLLEGIAALAGSGMTEGLPWVVGADGEKQVFEGRSTLPDNLRLPTMSGKHANNARKKRAHAIAEATAMGPKERPGQDARHSEANQEAVAKDQGRDDWFVADPWEAVGDTTLDLWDAADAIDSGRGEKTTPLDTRIGREAGGLDSALEDSQYHRGNVDVPAYERRNSRPDAIRDRADTILDKLRSMVDGKPVKQDVAGAIADIRARLNAAKGFGERGGIQYAFPLAQVLNPDVLGMADLSMEQSRALLAIRSELSALLADSKDLKPYERTQLVKQMAGAEHAGKVNVTNAQRLLEKGAEGYRTALAEAARAEAEKQAKIDAKRAKTAAPEVAAAGAPKSQPKPGGVKLTGKTPFTPKDQAKADRATKFIGRGSERSSTAQYAKDFGALANTGSYTSADVVFVSAEGARAGRIEPDFAEIGKAVQAGATIITDAKEHRQREYNVGERQVAQFLLRSGYVESAPGEWSAPKRKLSLMSTQVHNDLQRPGFSATHDSPIRHEGKFNWREHTGKGEGNAAFGAGTYLSTGDKVHAFYKKMFTALVQPEPKHKIKERIVRALRAELRDRTSYLDEAVSIAVDEGLPKAIESLEQVLDDVAGSPKYEKSVRALLEKFETMQENDFVPSFGDPTGKSPTYHVSVGIMKAQLLNWDKPLSEQSSYVKKRLEGVDTSASIWEEHWGEYYAAVSDGTNIYTVPDDGGHAVMYKKENLGTFSTAEAAKEAAERHIKSLGLEFRTDGDALTGEGIYKGLAERLGSQAAASDYLQSLGILGHEYAAANGRNGTTPNYVIYDDSKISTNYVHFNKQDAGKFEGWKNGPTARAAQGMATDADIKAARDYVNKVLGPKIKTEFENITGYSGEWVEAENLIKVSTLTNAGVMNVARHEALHAFYSRFVKANPKAQRVLASLTDDPRVLRRLEALLKDEPEALGQLTDGEERLAYIHQFAQAGLLKLPHTPGTTLMAKVRKFLRRVFQMVSDQERAVDLLYSFERGDFRGLEPSAAGRVIAKSIDQGTWLKNGTKAFDKVMQAAAALTVPAHTILQNSVSPTARKIAELFYTNPADEAAGDKEPGYLNERNQQMRRYSNLFRNAVGELDEGQRRELLEAMQNETPTASLRDPDVQDAKEKLHAMFSRFHRYLTDEKGLRIGKINENYFPVVYDAEKVRDGSFAKMLREKYASNIAEMVERINAAREKGGKAGVPVSADDVIEAVVQRIAGESPMDDPTLDPLREDGVLRPWFAGGEKRTLNFLEPEDRAPFLEKDLVRTLSQYVRQGVRAAEYSSRFGRQGALLSKQLEAVRQELQDAADKMLKEGDLKDEKARDKWVSRQYRDVANAVGAMEGSLGHDVPEWVRKTNSAAIVYQNVRILPMALFSSFVDPLGIIARGGEMRDAFNAFARGMRDVARTWGDMLREEPKQRQKDEWEKLAEHVGVIDAAVFNHFLHDEYASVYLDGRAKKINEVMFKANGMEPFNRAMRVGATQSAVKFIERHSKKPEAHSARWMAELGFGKASPHFDVDGRLITDKNVLMEQNPGMSQEQAEAEIAHTHRAINRWVEGAILSPNAAQRPAWASDPHYSMFWHLKQFAYSFHQTIMKRAVSEAKHGNVLPLGVFAWYIPTMIAADVAKGMMLGAGELPNYMKGYDLGDWVVHGVNRAGVLGVGDIGVNAAREPLGLAGPMVEQISDIFTEPLEKNIVHALPANALYSRALS